MSKLTVLMLGHKSLVGKDTFFSFAKEEGFVRVAFADKLKETVADLYNFSHDQMHGDLKDVMDERYPNLIDPKIISTPQFEGVGIRAGGPIVERPNPDYKPFLTPRRVLQLFGQQQRSLFPDIWAAYIFNVKIPALVAEGHNKFVVTDFRFRNEANVALEWSKRNPDADLRLIKINRDIIARSGAGDISENDLNDFNCWSHQLQNNDTVDTFKSQVVELLASL